jgi:hypothetical protein
LTGPGTKNNEQGTKNWRLRLTKNQELSTKQLAQSAMLYALCSLAPFASSLDKVIKQK